jgi:hypothetical protein
MGRTKKGKKTGGSHRQRRRGDIFAYMGYADQQPFGIYFLLATEMESAEAHIVFYIADVGLDFHGTSDTQFLSQGGCEIFTSLPAVLHN